MADIFERDEYPVPGAPVNTGVKGHSVKLKIRQSMAINKPIVNGGVALVELSIDDHPISALLQEITFKIDAKTMIPTLALSIIPTDVELDLDAESLALLHPEVQAVYCLTKPGKMFLGKAFVGTDAEKLLAQYREKFPDNQGGSHVSSSGSNSAGQQRAMPAAFDPPPC